MADKLRWGILGTGLIAKMFTSDIQAAGLSVTAVGSRTQEAADKFALDYSIGNAHASYEALVADPEVDIIYVATPHPMHHENALLAIASGKHLLVEKAFTVNAKQATEIQDAASAANVFVMEAMWTRFLPMMVEVRRIIESGAIGEIRAILADHNQYIPMERAARLHLPELGGGALLDLGIYPISFAFDLLGKPKAVTAKATLTDLGVDELLAMIFEYESGAQASMHSGFMALGPNTASVIGSKGRIDIDEVWYNHTTFTQYDQAGQRVTRYEDKIVGRGMQYQALEVEKCIESGLLESPQLSLNESIEIMATMDEIRRQIGVKYPGE